jgi:hypothetical protein
MHVDRDDQATCGEGLAATAVVPAKLAELLTAQAEVLERHTKALDPTDPDAAAELTAYTTLIEAHRRVARELTNLAEEMAGYRDLPMADHDPAVIADPKGQIEAFSRYVAIERELSALLHSRLEGDQALLQPEA